MKPHGLVLLAIGGIVLTGCHNPATNHSNPATGSTTATRDAATAFNSATNTGSVMTVGGAATTGAASPGPTVQPITVCDHAVNWDAPSQGASDGYTEINGIATGATQMRVCSYAILNGAIAQDVQLYEGNTSASSSSGNVCGVNPSSQKPYMTYHLGPYESISRGSGLGVLYTLGTNSGICVHRVQNGTNPLGIEVTYTIY